MLVPLLFAETDAPPPNNPPPEDAVCVPPPNIAPPAEVVPSVLLPNRLLPVVFAAPKGDADAEEELRPKEKVGGLFLSSAMIAILLRDGNNSVDEAAKSRVRW